MSVQKEIHAALGSLQADMESGKHQRAAMFAEIKEMRSTSDKLAGCLPGLKKMLEDHETRLRTVEADNIKRAGRAAGAGAAGGGLVAFATMLAAWLGLK